jgi:hypothetical protein
VRHRPVLAANASGLLVSIGFYPLLSLVVRYVQTLAHIGYGFGAPVVIAGPVRPSGRCGRSTPAC